MTDTKSEQSEMEKAAEEYANKKGVFVEEESGFRCDFTSDMADAYERGFRDAMEIAAREHREMIRDLLEKNEPSFIGISGEREGGK